MCARKQRWSGQAHMCESAASAISAASEARVGVQRIKCALVRLAYRASESDDAGDARRALHDERGARDGHEALAHRTRPTLASSVAASRR